MVGMSFKRFSLLGCLALSLLLAPQRAAAQKARALLIGISNYPACSVQNMQWNAIHGANDVEMISNVLAQKGFLLSSLTNQNATAANIRKALSALGKAVAPGDLVYIHFSGHGQPVEDVSGDEADGWDEAFVPFDAYRSFQKGFYEGGQPYSRRRTRPFCRLHSR